jgi:hypothetical protein
VQETGQGQIVSELADVDHHLLAQLADTASRVRRSASSFAVHGLPAACAAYSGIYKHILSARS